MGFSKFETVNNKSYYKNVSSIKALIKYILKDKETGGRVPFYGGTYIDLITSDKAEQQLRAVKKYFKKTDNRQIYHYILSFPSNVKNPWEVYEIGFDVVSTFFEGYQTMFAVHENTDNLHIHIILNSVSFVSGKKWHLTDAEYFSLKYRIEQLADSHFQGHTLQSLC